MSYRRLGSSGVTVSTLCIGTMMFGDRTDEREAREIVALARDRGINFIDTADVYSLGASERMTGPLIGKSIGTTGSSPARSAIRSGTGRTTGACPGAG